MTTEDSARDRDSDGTRDVAAASNDVPSHTAPGDPGMDRVQALEARVAALEARLAQLQPAPGPIHAGPAPPQAGPWPGSPGPPARGWAPPYHAGAPSQGGAPHGGPHGSAPAPAWGAPTAPGPYGAGPAGPNVAPAPATPPPAAPPRAPASAEDWIARIGIGLLVLGTAFLFKYSIDRGWVGPPVRVGIGYAVGAILLFAGQRTIARRPGFGELLMGGGLAAFYIATYAAHVLYALVPVVPALGVLAGVGGLGLALAVRYARPALAVVAAIGGFAAPIVVDPPAGTELAVLGYLTLLIGATAAVHALRRWGALLAFAGIGAVVCLALVVNAAPASAAPFVVAAATVAWVGYAIVPALWSGQPVDAPPPGVWHASVILAPLLWLAQAVHLFDLEGSALAAWSGGVFAVLVGLAIAVRARDVDASVHRIAAAVTVALWILYAFEANALQIAFTAYAAALYLVGHVVDGRGLRGLANATVAVLALVVGARIVDGGGADGFSADAGADALAVAVAWFGVVVHVRAARRAATLGGAVPTAGSAATALHLAAHVGTMAWAFRYVGTAGDQGQAAATVVWALMAAVTLVAGFVARHPGLRQIGMVTLVAVVAKLLLVDLAEVATVLRILLFMGFGAAFLVLSYVLPGLVREPETATGDGAADPSSGATTPGPANPTTPGPGPGPGAHESHDVGSRPSAHRDVASHRD